MTRMGKMVTGERTKTHAPSCRLLDEDAYNRRVHRSRGRANRFLDRRYFNSLTGR